MATIDNNIFKKPYVFDIKAYLSCNRASYLIPDISLYIIPKMGNYIIPQYNMIVRIRNKRDYNFFQLKLGKKQVDLELYINDLGGKKTQCKKKG